MAKATGNVTVIVGGNTKPLEQALGGANRILSRFAASVPGVGGLASSAISGGVAGVAMAGANKLGEVFSGVAATVATQIEALDAAAKTAAATGFDAESFLGLDFAAQLSDMTSEAFAASMMKMRKAMGEASQGSDEVVQSLRMMGVEYRDIQNLSPDEQLKAIADGFQRSGGHAAALTGMLKIFGRGAGPEMADLLNQGSEGLKKYQERAKAMGLTVTDEQAKMAQEVSDAWKELRLAASGAARAFTVELLPALIEIAKVVREITPYAGMAGRAAAGPVSGNFNLVRSLLGTGNSQPAQKPAQPVTLPDLTASMQQKLPSVAEYGSEEAYRAVISALREDPAIGIQQSQLEVLRSIDQNTRHAGNDGAATVGKLA